MRAVCLLFIIVLPGCKSGMTKKENTTDSKIATGPPTFVYKTRADYRNLVPVLLSDDKTSIISYPHPADLKSTNGLQIPTLLNEGYLLDNRGIGRNVAFLDITYDEYSKLETVPSLEQLYSRIVDKDPLTSLCNCGNRNTYKNIVTDLNKIIDNGDLKKKCVVVK